jgi:NTP pyrophosphatase (non-canonical NTP hydrolase)
LKDPETTVDDLKVAIRKFIRERDWEKYHNPKDIAESICIEAAELLQLFQWQKPENSREVADNPSKLKQVKEELADIAIYCLSMANAIEIDVAEAVFQKINLNKTKYPVSLYKGKAHLNTSQ